MVWAQHPITAAEIIAQLTALDSTWHPKTARTLLARLVRKKALGYEAKGRTYFYEPLVTEQECAAAASTSFIDRVFGGSIRPMLVQLVESKASSRRRTWKSCAPCLMKNPPQNPRARRKNYPNEYHPILTDATRCSGEAGVLALLVLLAQTVFRKNLSPQWRSALWLVVAVRLLVPVSLGEAA